MRVVLLSPLPPEQTGLAEYAAQWRRAVHAAGVRVLTPMQGQKPPQSLAEARRWVAERDWKQVDVVHAELGVGRHSEYYVLAALAALPEHPRLSVTAHDPDRLVWQPVGTLWRRLDAARWVPGVLGRTLAALLEPHTLWAERRLARRLDGAVTHTRCGAQRLGRRMKIPADRVRVIPRGTLPLTVQPLPPLTPLRLLYFGFLAPGKGLEDLIDALARLRRKQPDLAATVQLTLAGGTPPDMDFGRRARYLDGVRERVAALGLQDQVTWSPDVDERDLPDLVGRHHVMVLPDRAARKPAWIGQPCGTSGALAWAIAAGRGVITTDTRALAEEVAHGNGVTCPPGNVAALADAIAALLNEPERVAQWARAAQVLAEQRNWARAGQAFAAYLRALQGGVTVAAPAMPGPASSSAGAS